MHRALAAFTLVAALVVPLTASADTPWEMLKEEWGYRPWAVIIAIPALVVTAPFMGAKALIDMIGSDGDDE